MSDYPLNFEGAKTDAQKTNTDAAVKQKSENAGRAWTKGEKALLGFGILFTVVGVAAIAMSAYTLSPGNSISVPGIGEVMNSEAAGYTLGAGLASFAIGVALFVKLKKDRARLTVESPKTEKKPEADAAKTEADTKDKKATPKADEAPKAEETPANIGRKSVEERVRSRSKERTRSLRRGPKREWRAKQQPEQQQQQQQQQPAVAAAAATTTTTSSNNQQQKPAARAPKKK